MDIKNPLYLKKIIEHYQNRIDKIKSDKIFEIRTEIADGLVDGTAKSIPNLIKTLGNVDKVIRIDEKDFPEYHSIICMALNQYDRDLNVDWNTLENRFAHNSSYLKPIKKEIEIVKSMKKDYNCGS
ncbi:MAG: hypothetical protein KGI19_00980 [Thaumarchaeota archaeon]|nr:hypothetical protein [Nitrososphaerota archaeon]MDE1817158.1 hypothetical protein [Nitrososphaerota archaeon]